MCVLCRGTSFLNIIFNFDFIIAFAFITMNVYWINILFHRKFTSTSFQIRTNFPICSNNTSYIICYIYIYNMANKIILMCVCVCVCCVRIYIYRYIANYSYGSIIIQNKLYAGMYMCVYVYIHIL